ncbi:hemerythrin domain-containing protein [Guyparkeria sp. SCN-R1]|uniref:hemerythrin domain-containing protein n=1 Tax=unclassified Guyparkeria TaxID=2626246 RepID=UPI000F64C7DF|nr:hemerythrin domain-containing protein [Guyparkeria sp. SCN-R1]RRQ24228.1 hemerythrin domain-containing protein [Guyparkeria sp. SCN-R1]
MNIFEALRCDHDVQRDLLDQLTATHGQSERREKLLRETRDALVHHENAEEKYFYVPLMNADLTQEQARHSIAEHHEIDEALETLENTEASSPAWLMHAKKLREIVLHHLEEEEHQVFQQAGKVLTETEKRELADKYRREMNEQARGE